MSTPQRHLPGSEGPGRLHSALWAVAKLAMAGAIIAAMAFGVAVIGQQGSVSESHAIIYDLGFAPEPDQKQFSDALKSLGHDDPQVFDINGNTVHFSVDYRRERPDRIAERYQREFVNRNINDRMYNSMNPSEGEELLTARMTGQVAPVRKSDNRIVMGGMLTRNKATDRRELIQEFQSAEHEDDLFGAHRWVEIFREPGDEYATVLATWSNDDFSYEKMLPGNEYRDQSVTNRGADPDVPACPGCVRVNQFSDLEDPRGYRSSIFVTDARGDEMIDFYRRVMLNRGWSISDMQHSHEQIGEAVNFAGDRADRLHLENDEHRLEIFAYGLGDGSVAIQTALWDLDSEPMPINDNQYRD